MCIIVWKPKGKTVPEENLKRCYESNGDGCGIMFSTGEELKLFKGLFSFKEFMELYRRHEQEALLMHFRIKTHGFRNKDNSHPFIINNSLGFAHNGVISGVGTSTNYSDTYLFNENLLKQLPDGWEDNKETLEMLEKFIGKSNKLAILRVDGKILIVNEGVWDDGVWYSHGGYKPYKYTATNTVTHTVRREEKVEEDKTIGRDVCRICFGELFIRHNASEIQTGMCYSCASKFVCTECLYLKSTGHDIKDYELTQNQVALENGLCKAQARHGLDIAELYLMDVG